MNQQKLMIYIFGPSTSGKSTVAELIKEHVDRLYTVDFDVIKRQISNYQWQRDGDVATEITRDTLNSIANTGLPILILLPVPKDEESYDPISKIANEHGYTLFNIEITAPAEVLTQRYKDRLRRVEESGSKWHFKTLEEFQAKLQTPYFKPENTITFDSSMLSPDEIFNEIKRVGDLHD